MKGEKKSVEFTRFDCEARGEETRGAVGGARTGSLFGSAGKALHAYESFGCDLRGGVLRAGLGVEARKLPSGAGEFERVGVREILCIDDCFARGEQCWLVRYDGGAMELYTPEGVLEIEGDFSARAAAILPLEAGVSVPIVRSGQRLFRVGVSGKLVELDAVCDGPFCYFRDRLFYGKDGEVIGYSAPAEPFSFAHTADDGGEIALIDEGGEIVALAGHGDAVYALRSHSIRRLVAVGAARDFRVESVAYGGGAIEGGSVAAAGDGLWFAATDGVYRADGRKCERIAEGVLPRGAESVVGVVGAEGYFLSYRVDGQDECALVAENGAFYRMRGVRALGRVGEDMLGVCGESIVAFCVGGEPADEAEFVFNASLPLGNHAEKTVTGVTICGDGGVEVEISSERKCEKRCVQTVRGAGRVKLAVKGREFSCKMRLSGSACVRSMCVEYQEWKGVKA